MTMFVAKRCVAELHELARDERAAHLHEIAEVAAALHEVFAPRKLEYEALGNPGAPIWEDLDFLRMLWTRSGRAAPDVVDARRAALLRALRNTDVAIEAEYV